MDNSRDIVPILTDNVEPEPTFEFKRLSQIITNLIVDSPPHFTLGVYGEWGTGKTTLMKLIMDSIKNVNLNSQYDEKKIIPVWFNAWRYEREEQLATIALMKTIAYALSNHSKFNKLSDSIKRTLKIFGKDLLSNLALQTAITEEGIDEMKEKFSKKMEFLNDIEKDTIYFDGLKIIEESIKEIREDDPQYRIVVFIDDLDRCSPNKALEILESIKVFLDIEGFVYIVGLSHKTVSKLISSLFQPSEIDGEQYIKKIIQIPIQIPPWKPKDLENLIAEKILPELGRHQGFIQSNKMLISKIVEPTPRELKRFINNLVISVELFFGNEREYVLDKTDLILVEALKSRWNDFYILFSMNDKFRNTVYALMTLPLKDIEGNELERLKQIIENPENFSKQTEDVKLKPHLSLMKIPASFRNILLSNLDENLWEFLNDKDILDKIIKLDWEYYRKVNIFNKDYFEEEPSDLTTNDIRGKLSNSDPPK